MDAATRLEGPLIPKMVDVDPVTMDSVTVDGVPCWLLEAVAEGASIMVEGANDDKMENSATDVKVSDKA